MKFKARLLACLLLVTGNASATKKDFLKKFIENLPYGSISQKLATGNVCNKPFIVFTKGKSINIFDLNGSYIKKMDIDTGDSVSSIDVIENYVVAGSQKGKIKVFDVETGWCTHTFPKIEDVNNVIVKTAKNNDDIYVISEGEYNNRVCVWNINGKWRYEDKKISAFIGKNRVVNEIKIICEDYKIFHIFLDNSLNSGISQIEAKSYQSTAAKCDMREKYNRYEDQGFFYKDAAIMCWLENGLVACRVDHFAPHLLILDSKENDLKKREIMDHYFNETLMEEPYGNICSIVSVPTTSYLYIFFKGGYVILFDWKKEKIIEKFFMKSQGIIGKFSDENDVVAGGLLPFNGKLYAIVGFKNGTVKTKQIFPCDDANIIVKE